MIKLLRWIQGYVAFECSGGFVERFLNLSKFANLNLWDVKCDGEKISAYTTLKEFEALKEPAQKSGMDINVIKKGGLPVFTKKHKWRCGILLGFLGMCLFIWFMSGFIWEVEIVPDGDTYIEGLTEYLEEVGVKEGARKSKINILETQEELLDEFPQLSWVTLNIFGSKAQIEYTYASEQKPIVDKNAFTNVVASKNGEITLVEGYEGTNMVKAGANVVEGSLLISGVIKNGDNTERFVHARGKVYARTQNKITKKCVFVNETQIITDKKQIFKIGFFGLEIPLGKGVASSHRTKTEIFLHGNDIILPVGFLRTDNLVIENTSCDYTERQTKYLCLLNCVWEKRKSYSDVQIENISYIQKVEKNGFSLVMDIICVENIALEILVDTEKN